MTVQEAAIRLCQEVETFMDRPEYTAPKAVTKAIAAIDAAYGPFAAYASDDNDIPR